MWFHYSLRDEDEVKREGGSAGGADGGGDGVGGFRAPGGFRAQAVVGQGEAAARRGRRSGDDARLCLHSYLPRHKPRGLF